MSIIKPKKIPKYLKGKNYFTKKTDNAIIRYNIETDPKIKSQIFEEEIYYPFYKLTENIIHSFKFYNTEVEDLEDLQQEVIIFLLSKISKFDPDLGYKGYSYFSIIAKRYLINCDLKNYNKKINSIPVDYFTNGYNSDTPYLELSTTEEEKILYYDEIFNSSEGKYKQDLSDFIDKFILYFYNNLDNFIQDKVEIKIADIVLSILENRDNVKIFNKKAIYFSIKEFIGFHISTQKITRVIKYIYKIFNEEYNFFIENGYTRI